MEKIIAIVPARGGSKGFPNKNIHTFKGKTLLERAIDIGTKSEFIDEVYVSSDNTEYLEIADKAGSKTHLRSKKTASDNASMKEVLIEVHQFLSEQGPSNFWYIPIYPTFALNTHHEVDNAIKTYTAKSDEYSDGLVGVRKPNDHPYLMVQLDLENRIQDKINPDFNKYYRRQEYPSYWCITHQTVIVPHYALMNINNQLIGSNTYFHPVVTASVDVDYESNLKTSVVSTLLPGHQLASL